MDTPLHNIIRNQLSKIMIKEHGIIENFRICNYYIDLAYEWDINDKNLGHIWCCNIQYYLPEIIEDYDNPENDIVTPYYELIEDYNPSGGRFEIYIAVNSNFDILQDNYMIRTSVIYFGEPVESPRKKLLMFSEALLSEVGIVDVYKKYILEKFFIALQCIVYSNAHLSISYDMLYIIHKILV